jgi:hypothetical protein
MKKQKDILPVFKGAVNDSDRGKNANLLPERKKLHFYFLQKVKVNKIS